MVLPYKWDKLMMMCFSLSSTNLEMDQRIDNHGCVFADLHNHFCRGSWEGRVCCNVHCTRSPHRRSPSRLCPAVGRGKLSKKKERKKIYVIISDSFIYAILNGFLFLLSPMCLVLVLFWFFFSCFYCFSFVFLTSHCFSSMGRTRIT